MNEWIILNLPENSDKICNFEICYDALYHKYDLLKIIFSNNNIFGTHILFFSIS